MAKRHAENISIGDALKEFIGANRLEKGLDKMFGSNMLKTKNGKSTFRKKGFRKILVWKSDA